jgi:hypothetical protein
MKVLGDACKWNPILVCLETVLVLDRCMVCAKRTTGSESFWTHQMELLGELGHVESRFGPFGDSVSVGAR